MDGIFGVKDKDKFTCVNFACGQFADEVTLCLGKDYEIKIDGDKVTVVKTKPKYPTTYADCCKIIGVSQSLLMRNYMPSDTYKLGLIDAFQKLLICRDAYWKIAGEEMGLCKPWKPNWDDENEYKYCLYRLKNIIYKDATFIIPTLLIFPTMEMRDAFYENFKDLIEMCKELL